jgi:hypothetical protein
MSKTYYYLTSLALLLAMVLMTSTLMAQDTLRWTGAISDSATLPANWEPQNPITTNTHLYIDSAYKFTNQPVFKGSDSILIHSMTVQPTGVLTIEFDDSLIWFDVATEYFVPLGTVNINKGTLRARRLHINDTTTFINISSGGLLVARKYFFMAGYHAGDPLAGFLTISGTGKAVYTAEQATGGFGRFPTDTTTGVITLNPMGTLDLKGNFADLCNTAIAKNQLVAAEGYRVVVDYDAGNDLTYVYIQDATVFLIEPTDPVRLYEDEEGDTIKTVKNEGYDAMASFEWKYSTTSGSGYTSFDTPVTKDWIVPMFADPGHYYLVCEGTKTEGGTKILSNEVEVFVASSKVVVIPGEDQSLRAGLDGAMLTVTKDGSITGVEWKWSDTLGSGYESFDPVQTGDEFTPNIDSNGVYWIVCEGTDGSETYMSKDVMVLVGDAAFNIYWNGSKSHNAREAANWDPIANVDGNIVNVGAPDTYGDSLAFNGPGNININKIFLTDTLTTMTVDMGTDTLRVSNNSYGIAGHLIIKSGVFNYRDLRHERSTGMITVEGGEFLIRSSYFMMGNKGLNSGAYLNIVGDGKFVSMEQQPGRFSNDTTQSIIFISENGMLQVPDDWRGGAETAMTKNQLVTTETEELVVTWPVSDDSVTQVTVRNLLVFDIAPVDDQLVAVGEDIATLSTVNDDYQTSVEWKYSTTSGGPYMAFSPVETATDFSGSFDAAGDYFIVCEGYAEDTVLSVSEVMVQVVSVDIAPTDDQSILVGVTGTLLTVTESVAADSREWKSSTTSGSGYTPIPGAGNLETYTPLFLIEGTYYVICASTFGTKTINSNEVKVDVLPTYVEDNMDISISMYPNPAQMAFYIDAGDYSTYDVKVMDLTGRTVLTREYLNVTGPQKIEVEHQGIYFVSITTVDGIHTAKIIMK